MIAAAVPATFAGFFLLSFQRTKDWRGSFLTAALSFGLLIAFGTELLNAFGFLTAAPVSAFWLITLLLLCLGIYRQRQHGAVTAAAPASEPCWSAFEKVFLAGIILILLVAAVVAFVNPPNTWDSMTYHMSRVAHWVQNESLANYPTSIRRQTFLAPYAEFVILHLQLLSAGDRFANFVQWFAAAGTLVAVSLLAAELGANRQIQLLAAVICLTIPIGLLQISSTQTDYVLSFWIASAVYYILLLRRSDAAETNHPALKAAACVALAILTKGLAYFIAFPFCIWLSVIIIARQKKQAWKILSVMALVALAINFAHYFRTAILYGSPLGSSFEDGPNCKLMNDYLTVSTLTSNVLRNLAVDLATPFAGINTGITLCVLVIHNLLGLDASDPHTTWWITGFFIRTYPFNEVLAGSPLQAILALLCLTACLFAKKLRANKALIPYACAIIAGYLLLVFFNRWHPWMGRYHLPSYVLASPLIAVVICEYGRKIACNITGSALLALAIPYLLLNDLRPLVGSQSIFALTRNQQYFLAQKNLETPFEQACALVRSHGSKSVAISSGWDGWEYPLWILLSGREPGSVHIEHAEVKNITNKLKDPSATAQNRPTALIELLDLQAPKEHSPQFSQQWRQAWESGCLRVYFLPGAKD